MESEYDDDYEFDTSHFFGEGLKINDDILKDVTNEANRLVPRLNELNGLLKSGTYIPEELRPYLEKEFDAMFVYFEALKDRCYYYYPFCSLWLKTNEELEELSKKELSKM